MTKRTPRPHDEDHDPNPETHDITGPTSAEELASPCACDFHRGMTADQAWSTLP